jgi:hypothetical protein
LITSNLLRQKPAEHYRIFFRSATLKYFIAPALISSLLAAQFSQFHNAKNPGFDVSMPRSVFLGNGQHTILFTKSQQNISFIVSESLEKTKASIRFRHFRG